MKKIGMGIVGYGKIAQDAHVGAIRASESFSLQCIAEPRAVEIGVPQYASAEEMLGSANRPAAIAVCTPPQARYAVAGQALSAGTHVLLEKPPCLNAEEGRKLQELAREHSVTLFCGWHSRFSPAVAPARDWLAQRRIRRVWIDWREDVRVWHPGQAWIWQPGGFGVFDPGINALSIATHLFPTPLQLRDALLRMPQDCESPSSAELSLNDSDRAEIHASFDFLKTGRPIWAIRIETDRGELHLLDGGARLVLDGEEQTLGRMTEYEALYGHFARLIAEHESDMDLAPLQLVNEALTQGRREIVPALKLH